MNTTNLNFAKTVSFDQDVFYMSLKTDLIILFPNDDVTVWFFGCLQDLGFIALYIYIYSCI